MIEQDELIKNKLFDLANKSYNKGISTNTKFLNLHEQDIFESLTKSLSFANPSLYGGNENCERKLVLFNSQNYTNIIKCIKIYPKNQKFSDKLTHRDFLGAILNLGIDYSFIGDIFVMDNIAIVFCLVEVSDYILNNLSKVKHTTIQSCYIDLNLVDISKNFKDKKISSNSLRIDAIISKIYSLNRESSKELFLKTYVSVRDMVCLNNSKNISIKDIISVRGYGKFIVFNIEEYKNKYLINIKQYI